MNGQTIGSIKEIMKNRHRYVVTIALLLVGLWGCLPNSQDQIDNAPGFKTIQTPNSESFNNEYNLELEDGDS
jgi:hypothetical protein